MNLPPHSTLLYKATLILLFLVLLVICLDYAQGILVPLIIAALLSMLLLPMVRKLEEWKMGRVLPIFMSVFSVIAVIGILITLLSAQFLSFSEDVPLIQAKLNERINVLQQWIENITGVGSQEQMKYVEQATSSMFGMAQSIATNILLATTSTFVFIGLVLVMMFFFLFYRHRIYKFLMMLIPKEEHINTQKIVSEISHVTQKYLTGVFTVIGILSVINSVLFLLIGVPHAIFFGVLASILNIIPYVGVWVGTLFPMIMMAITQDSITPVLLIVAGVWVNQQIDNNFLTPKITGSQVAINPLATILILIIGSMIWGLAGMVLFIPLLGVAKIIFDNVEGLKPLGYLIGEDKPDKPSPFIRLLHKIRERANK